MIRRLIHKLPYFSFTSNTRPSIINKLNESLITKIKEERKEFKVIANTGLLKTSGFKFVDSPGVLIMKVEKEFKECSVEIRYQANMNGEEEENKGIGFALIIKFKTGSGLLVDCFAIEEEFIVYKTKYYKDINKLTEIKDMKDAVEMSQEYVGPDFRTLDPKVQSSFTDYIRSFGIDKNLLKFISRSIKDKERLLYIIWLEKINEFANQHK